MNRWILIVIAICIVGVAVLALSGVLHVRDTKNETGVTIDKKELKEKTEEAVKKTEAAGGKVLDKTGEALHKAAEEIRGTPHDQKPPATTPLPDEKNKSLRQPDGGKDLPDNNNPQ
jgi:hypothetical protein